MKLLTYQSKIGPRLGLLDPALQRVIDLHAASRGRLPADMLTFLQGGPAMMDSARALLDKAGSLEKDSLPLEGLRILAPLSNPPKIMAIGRNYTEHSTEQNKKPPTRPILFAIYPSAIAHPGDTLRWRADLTQEVDYEGELVAVIGQTAQRVSEAEALNYVAGYTIGNDVTARDIQASDGQYTRGKSLDTFFPFGPYLVTPDEVPNPQALSLKTRLNGQMMQADSTSSMIFSVAFLISYLSHSFTLLPGDVLTTGTPSGVGKFRQPPVFLKTGDEISVEIEGLGLLSNTCQVE